MCKREIFIQFAMRNCSNLLFKITSLVMQVGRYIIQSLCNQLNDVYNIKEFKRVRTLLSSSKSMTFHELFPWPFLVFPDIRFSCHFRKFSKLYMFQHIFYLKQINRNKLWYPTECVPFALFNYSTFSYVILALSSAVTNLPNKTLIFHDFQGPTIKFYDFPGHENEIIKFRDFTNPV